MRLPSLVALVVTALLTACGGRTEAPAGNGTAAAPAAPSGPVVTGTVLADAPRALSPNATLTVKLLDVTRVDGEPIPVAEQTFSITAVPAEFSLTYDTAAVNSIRSYAVEATVMDGGQVAYVTPGRVGVLTQGKPSRVNVMLAQAMAAAAVKDPVVEMNKEFAEFETMLGGLKSKRGQRVIGPEGKETAAIGWDAFLDDSGVRMVRETVTDAEGGNRSTRKFAYKDGKPWIAISDAGGSTVKIGWDADGNIVVKERDGVADESVAERADALKREAEEAAASVN